VSARERDYRNDIVAATGEKRRDRTLIPGASITFPNLFAAQTGLRLEYQYIWNNSNDQTKKFNDHIVGASLIAKFNPALFGRPQEAAAPR